MGEAGSTEVLVKVEHPEIKPVKPKQREIMSQRVLGLKKANLGSNRSFFLWFDDCLMN
jgi:hypothetical protein